MQEHWERFRWNFRTKTRDTSKRALAYLQGQLTMKADRHFAGIADTIEAADGQAMQHFMSESPWKAEGLYEQIQEEIESRPELQKNGLLILDEYGDEK